MLTKVPSASRWFSTNSSGSTGPIHAPCGVAQRHADLVLRAEPDLELVLRVVLAVAAGDDPVDVDVETGRGDRAAGVDAAHDKAHVVGRFRFSWPALPAATQTLRPGVASQRVDPAIDRRARDVVRVTVGAEADVDRHRHAEVVAERDQLLDRVREARRIVEGFAAVPIRRPERQQHRGDRRLARDAGIARGDARDVGAVRTKAPSAIGAPAAWPARLRSPAAPR